MSTQVQEIAKMLDMLPTEEQDFALEIMKRIILAWDPDYTKLTPKEAEELEQAKQSGYVDADEIDWDDLSEYEA